MISDSNPQEHQSLFVNRIWDNIWPHCNCYPLSQSDDYTRWFLMDEVGLSIRHSSNPNCCIYTMVVDLRDIIENDSITTSLSLLSTTESHLVYALSFLWPVRDIDEGGVLTRNYLPDIPLNDPIRPLKLLGFYKQILSLKEGYIQKVVQNVMPQLQNKEELGGNESNLLLSTIIIPSHWNNVYDMLLLKMKECEYITTDETAISRDNLSSLKVFCDRPDHLNSNLLIPRVIGKSIQLVNSAQEADVLYLIDYVVSVTDDSVVRGNEATDKNIRTDPSRNVDIVVKNDEKYVEHIKTNKMCNQFSWNGLVISKEQLVKTVIKAEEIKIKAIKLNDVTGINSNDVHKKFHTIPWLPLTFDLSDNMQLASFIHEFADRQDQLKGMLITICTTTIECLYILQYIFKLYYVNNLVIYDKYSLLVYYFRYLSVSFIIHFSLFYSCYF